MTFPLAVSVLARAEIVTSELAVTGALNVLAASTVTVCVLVKARVVLPSTAKTLVTVAVLAVSPALRLALAWTVTLNGA